MIKKNERIFLQSSDLSLPEVMDNLNSLKEKDNPLRQVLLLVLRSDGLYFDVLQYLCKNPYCIPSIYYRLKSILSTDASLDWYQLINLIIQEKKEDELLFYLEAILMAIESNISVKDIRNAVNKNFSSDEIISLIFSNKFTKIRIDQKPLEEKDENQRQSELSTLQHGISSAMSDIFQQNTNKLEQEAVPSEYEGIYRYPTNVFYPSQIEHPPFLVSNTSDMFQAAIAMIQKIQIGYEKKSKRVDKLNRIIVRKDEMIYKLREELDALKKH